MLCVVIKVEFWLQQRSKVNKVILFSSKVTDNIVNRVFFRVKVTSNVSFTVTDNVDEVNMAMLMWYVTVIICIVWELLITKLVSVVC